MSRISRSIGCMVCCVFVASAAGAVAAADTGSLAGRWSGHYFRMAARDGCTGDDCRRLVLDVSRCGEGWCGVLVGKDGTCGATALRLGAGGPGRHEGQEFTGRLELAPGAEPYTIHATLGSNDGSPRLWLTGDTGGEYRFYRRTFPFEAQLSRSGDAVCRGESKTS